MQRRTFISGMAASLALGTQIASAQRTTRAGSTVLTSEFTGATIDFTDSGLEIMQFHVDDAEGVEHAHFKDDGDGRFDINFFPTELGDAGEYAKSIYNMWQSTLGKTVELIDEQAVEDGGWLIWSLKGGLMYMEYQYGSYPKHDLVTFMQLNAGMFPELFQKAQLVKVDDLPPMLFDADSGILAVAEQHSAGTGTTATSASTSTRTTRSTSSTSNTTESATTSTGVGAAADVIAHREKFWTSYEEFFALLEIVGDETVTKTESSNAWASMANISLEWQQYPTTAAELTFSAAEADLESTYLSWADLVGQMGVSFEQFFMGAAEVDEFVAIFGEFELVDGDLATILDGLGSLRDHNLRAKTDIQNVIRNLGSVNLAA